MPTYQYRCKDCGADLEVFQKFTDDALTECPTCQGRLRKVFSPVGVVFKGSGFYATDNRTKGASSAATGSDSTAKAGAPAKDAASAPAAAPSTSASSTGDTTGA